MTADTAKQIVSLAGMIVVIVAGVALSPVWTAIYAAPGLMLGVLGIITDDEVGDFTVLGLALWLVICALFWLPMFAVIGYLATKEWLTNHGYLRRGHA